MKFLSLFVLFILGSVAIIAAVAYAIVWVVKLYYPGHFSG